MSEKAGNIKPFEELTIKDDFMFGAVMSEEKNLKPLLEYILNIKIAHITYPERQKTISANYGYKSVRLDVYCEDDNNTVYNIEIQVANEKDLAKRIRYYHDMIDINILEQGRKVTELKNSIVIFICDFDYYGKAFRCDVLRESADQKGSVERWISGRNICSRRRYKSDNQLVCGASCDAGGPGCL